MRNPWRMQDGPDNNINRNNFPMSFQYNGTFKYGKIYPIGLWRTIPGASYQIDSTLALNFMPTSFPIQTRQRAYVHFFYGRDRNFWKDYKDFVNGMNPELVKPYIDEGVTKARTGNLLDYLGVPTTLVGRFGTEISEGTYSNLSGKYIAGKYLHYFSVSGYNYVESSPFSDIREQFLSLLGTTLTFTSTSQLPNIENSYDSNISYYQLELPDVPSFKDPSYRNVVQFKFLREQFPNAPLYTIPPAEDDSIPYVSPTPRNEVYTANIIFLACLDNDNKVLDLLSPTKVSDDVIEFPISTSYSKYILLFPQIYEYVFSNNDNNSPGRTVVQYQLAQQYILNCKYISYLDQPKDIDENTSPYWRSNDDRGKQTIKLSAIPPRMYETIYNLYYRNPQNNPYILNGKPEYNVFIPTKDGGVDNNLYELRYRNWEDDFLTTAVQTPQQGIAPLVGLTDRGATVTLTNEDGSVTRYKTNLDEYGNVIGFETTDTSEPLLTQALIDAVSYGISIEDLRNVNAMQKWLELNLRKGYQYKDIIEARWGISISYNELDLPEFIGGFTQEVGLQAVTQTTSHGDKIEGALGWQAGRMYAAGSGREITHYCEEEGYIMALLTVVPVPNYSQLLPKHWFTRDLLDSYQPEFNHIGFQPITYKEVCPIQAFQESTENVDVLEQTFGYQRPWYEYFNQVDEVHGQFRTTFKDFLINRTFDVKPELSESFLLVDPNQINDVFAVQTDDDKIIGAIEHRITAKLPISLYAQARLE